MLFFRLALALSTGSVRFIRLLMWLVGSHSRRCEAVQASHLRLPRRDGPLLSSDGSVYVSLLVTHDTFNLFVYWLSCK